MAGKIRFLLQRDGRFWARKVVPEELRSVIGKTELRVPLGADRRTAIAQLPAALVMIDEALRGAARAVGSSTPLPTAAMDLATLARTHYAQRLAQDTAARDLGPAWASIGINDEYVAAIRAVVAGRMSDGHVEALLGDTMREFEQRGQLVASRRTPEWRQAARVVADAELHALERALERDEGVPPSSQQHPAHLVLPEIDEAVEKSMPFVSLRALLEAHIQHLESDGRGRTARKAWPRIFEHLIEFVAKRRGSRAKGAGGPDDANALTPDDLVAWRDDVLQGHAGSSASDGYGEVSMRAKKAALDQFPRYDF